jgi:hypothetical protein
LDGCSRRQRLAVVYRQRTAAGGGVLVAGVIALWFGLRRIEHTES